MKILGGVLSLVIFIFSNVSVNAGITDEDSNDLLIVRAHNVGQGNCTSLSYRDAGKKKLIFIDGGSSSFRDERMYTELQSPPQKQLTPSQTQPRRLDFTEQMPASPEEPQIPTEQETLEFKTPSSTTSTNISYQQSPDYTEIVEDPGYEEEEIEEDFTKENLVERIYNELGLEDENKIEVPIAIVSHPDKDHYNLYPIIFSKNYPFILQNLVLAGRPKQYIKDNDFKGWLIKIMEDANTNIYFPTVFFNDIELKIGLQVKKFTTDVPSTITPSLLKKVKQDLRNTSEVNLAEKLLLAAIAKMKTWAPHTQKFSMADTLKLGKVATMHPLAINPTHALGENNTVLRHSQKEDSNTDSLAFHIKSEHFSVMIMGDATELTTNRIINNYAQKLDQLKADIYILAHHGASSHGSNNKRWLKIVDPQYAFISNGHLYGHPRNKVYENLKNECKRLRKVKLHKVLTGDKPSSKGNAEAGIRHTTTRAILSTLNSGTLTAILGKKSLDVSTDKDDLIDKVFPLVLESLNLHSSREQKEEIKESKKEDIPQPTQPLEEDKEQKVKFKKKRGTKADAEALLYAKKFIEKKK